jgi:hypothetical protein
MQRVASTARFRSGRAAAVIGATLLSSMIAVGCGSSGSGGGNTACDVDAIFAKGLCSTASTCHDAQGSGGKFDMTSPGWQTHLVGVTPKGGGAIPSMCSTNPQPYLDPGSNPATGLFLRKLSATPGCGLRMPYLRADLYLSQSDLTCVTKWATTLTTGGTSDGGGGG